MAEAFFVTGIGTEVGKTVAAAILVEALKADYWKPVQSGDLEWTDTMKVAAWTGNDGPKVFHPEAYRLRTPMSPHASAAIDGMSIELSRIQLPETGNHLIVEGAGGLMVPLNENHCIIDLIEELALPVILVSRHYLGSINHTLLSIEALHRRQIPIAAIVFNGDPHPTTEEAILNFGRALPVLRCPELPSVDRASIRAVAGAWRPLLEEIAR